MTKAVDLAQRRFGRLTVVRRDAKNANYWWCFCECTPNSYRRVFRGNLTSGGTKSCGCLRTEKARVQLTRIPRRIPTLLGWAGALRKNYIYNNAKNRKKTVSFKLTVEECLSLFLGDCYYCGASPSQKFATGAHTYDAFKYNGIDRINNVKGYVKNNCVSCCRICNFAKHATSMEDFLSWVKRVYDHSIKRHSNTA